MFNLGFFELIVVIVVGLIVLGPEKFPKAARQVARFMNELKRAFTEIKSGFSDIEEETKKNSTGCARRNQLGHFKARMGEHSKKSAPADR